MYQMYPISWEGENEKNAFDRMTEHLERIRRLGCDGVWLSPFYPSPRCDHGYDITDYESVDERLGTLNDFRTFVETAHQMRIKVLIDLVLNHTSIYHPWFSARPDYYCWANRDQKGWKNLFDNGPAWTYSPKRQQYYLHLFHKKQADLNWFPNDKLNENLVQEFQRIINYWTDQFKVDGFRLDIPQAINKDLSSDKMEISNLIFGDKAIRVIDSVFNNRYDLEIMTECIDPTNGKVIRYYANNTPSEYILDISLKDVADDKDIFYQSLKKLSRDPRFMLDLESHDSPRFPSRKDITPKDMIWWMFASGTQNICLYQGQELGLKNPSKEELPDEKMLALDAQTSMRARRGEGLDELRPLSRANARVPLPLSKYERQEEDPNSCLSLTKAWIKRWKSGL